MRKFFLLMAMLMTITTYADAPAKIIHANQLTYKLSNVDIWPSEWEYTDATFMLYKVQGVMKQVDAFIDPDTDFKVPLTFFVYEETRTIEHNDRCYYLMVYTAGQKNTTKVHDRSQYFKITTQHNGISTVKLYNYQGHDWEWIVDGVTK